jgi:hypothetical protein
MYSTHWFPCVCARLLHISEYSPLLGSTADNADGFESPEIFDEPSFLCVLDGDVSDSSYREMSWSIVVHSNSFLAATT